MIHGNDVAMGGKETKAALERLLGCKSIHLRSEAAVALIKISGVPEAKQDNLEVLFKLLGSKDERIEDAIMQMGNPALVFLSDKLDEIFPADRQHAARILALHIRKMLDEIPLGQEPFSWQARHNISLQTISNLYRFRITKECVFINQVTMRRIQADRTLESRGDPFPYRN
jgi:hypothetical protein